MGYGAGLPGYGAGRGTGYGAGAGGRYGAGMGAGFGAGIPSGSAPAFSPSDIAGLKGWWAFDDATKLFQLSNGTTAVTANSDPVGYVTDLSGNGKHLIQATAGFRPLYKTGIQNSKSCALFDGSDDILALVSSIGAATAMTMFIVVKATANDGKFFMNGAGGADGAGLAQIGALRNFLAEAVANQTAGTMSHLVFEQWVGTRSAVPLFVLRVNGAVDAVTPDNSAINAPSKCSLGGDSVAFTGYIAEAGIYDTVLSAGNITSLESYLNSKWAVY